MAASSVGILAVTFIVITLATTPCTAALDKQIKLEDIERDNLQTELLRRPHAQQPSINIGQQEQLSQLRHQQLQLHQQQQFHRQQQIAYQQQLLQQQPRYSQPPQEQPQQAHQPASISAYQQQAHQPASISGYQQQYQQQLQQHREQVLLREREPERERERAEVERERPEQHRPHKPQQSQQSFQHFHVPVPVRAAHQQHSLQDVAAASPHIMYLIMPGGNIAAIPISHPNQIQALFAPVKQPFGTLYHQQNAANLPTQAVQYYQPHVPATVQTHTKAVQQQATQEHAQPARTQIQYVVPQQHRGAQPQFASQTQAQQVYTHAVQPQQQQHVIYSEAGSPAVETEYQFTQQIPQSQKSLYSAGVKSTVAPQIKQSAGYSTQTGTSFANFRQYSG